ncbi:exocyst complex component 6 [Planococcus citri]|uniref:exocyst complex component 6 n=1 Tax=Planococcus citri TaxID=170843 RepID=UPI0031F89974
MESGGLNYELFLQEIEGVDDYWGPTFRAIYECDDHPKFMEQLDKRIKYHDKEIERMCNNYYQGFIDSIKDLQQVRNQAKNLKNKVVEIDKAIQKSSKNFEEKCEGLVEARRIEYNTTAAISTLSSCVPVLATYSKLQKQISDKRYYPALKTLEQLEHLYLPRVSNLKFFQQMIENIPEIRENVKKVSMSDLKDFLENIRRLSSKIGEVAMRHTAEQLGSDLDVVGIKSKKKKHVPGDNSPDVMLESDEDLSAQHLIDFSPIYRCLHIYTVLSSRDVFENYYRTQREKQAGLVVQPPYSKLETIVHYKQYLQSIVGFFVQEDHILNTSSGLIDRKYLNELWDSSLSKIISTLKSQTVICSDANLLLRIKDLILLFAATLRNYGYKVEPLIDFLHEMKDKYNDILMQRWVQVFMRILEEGRFLPIQVSNPGEYEDIVEMFPFKNNVLEKAEFPKKFPFSAMVPNVYHEVKEFIYAVLKFTEDLNLKQAEVDDMIRKSTNKLLTQIFSSCLSSLFQKSNLTLYQTTQIIIDTNYLEKSSVYLEEFISNITGSSRDAQLYSETDIYLFKVARDDAERQICEKLKNKLDEFLELENYDWILVEPQGHASSFITDLIAFLKSTFESFTDLPAEVAQKACHSACEHIAKSLLRFMTSEDVKQISMGALQQINLDTIQCEQFAASEPVSGLEEGALLHYFNDLRQLLDLLMSWDWSAYFHDYGQENNKYEHVNPLTAIIILEKLREADKKSVFMALKKSERDKRKLLDTVLKQLRPLANIN